MLSPLVWYAALCVGPAAAFALLERGARAWTGADPIRRPGVSAPPAPVVRPPRPIELLADDLGRLRDELARLRRSGGYARRHHMLATALAYDDALRDCCRALDVPVEMTSAPLDPVERLRLEAELEAAGLTW
ncbi:hypothetical protein [Barrientosiimonas humi]|uniref:hypothetical protein n=1 Tax=Barrientosiimonas humi TaxID=999931 RepID=UPI00370D3720